jgi:hypothetical protein
MPNSPDEETTESLIANDRNYYKVEKWIKDGAKVERMLYAGSNLDKAREVITPSLLSGRGKNHGQVEPSAGGAGLRITDSHAASA